MLAALKEADLVLQSICLSLALGVLIVPDGMLLKNILQNQATDCSCGIACR